MAQNEVRIIGGMWKGRKLKFPRSPGLRPSLGRSRETLFNWMRTDVLDANCLDLFAGSGALGFEALSRGAASVVFVERNREAATSLRANTRALGARGVRIVRQDASRYLARDRDNDGFDLILLDPPFDTHLLERTLKQLATGHHLSPGALVYFETRRNNPFEHGGYTVVRESIAGDTQFGLLARS
ncbi:MAG: 16S rRNA (guanine(966)-N(2))-methyltransferase RsmD [Pseudomonadales bacterium]|jgi:16S rRNA (guanine966-N2)-methyltransferase|nr:16S rRNA (guanine(966)-N(2))-methyltransferase RsmD [Pseudomonadales bacterium]MDP6469445.1 16S rRNA (guanine(966)-N(2))-methyltransferase RsmD [Pseudomonadales bacterium]MDP6827287.1 16S rRNA (guanine(966)-N(2))-methyltransferase RsmD [Pseudomonadales bacterium]MDP6971110.1 16S rRNA (guanine(966)-N(2))-methyltransferase RsmD [Pseudomonadales bacterium]|tara:strand:- start:3835 stop:4389 length:555 start_codon:yes stop_codon:yes gene_type:complete